jgi:primase-polymerase (primpol)-like protein
MSNTSYTTTASLNIPPELRALDQWLAYRAVPKPNGKINKKPIDAKTRRDGSSTERATWSTYELAAKRSPVGAGFVLTNEDPYFAIDLDDCVDPESGVIEQWAQDVIGDFPTYWEMSLSDRGLHGIGRGVIPKDGRKKGGVEVYDDGRFVVITGRTLPGHATIRSCQQQLTNWHNDVWPIETPRPVPPPSPPPSSNNLTLDDLLAKAFNAKNGDKVRRLYEGDIGDYPESQGDPGFSSEADLALAGYLGFWTQDDDLVAEAMRSSKLYRKKLDRQDYTDRTIQRVRTNQTAWWDPSYVSRDPLPMIAPPIAVGATCPEQLQHAQDAIVLLTAQLQDAKQTISVREGVIVRERELRIAAEARANRLGFERSQIMQVLRNPDLAAGPKLTHFATILDLGARIANGEAQTPVGFRLPAKRIADNTGQKVAAVRRHWNEAATSKLLTKTNVRETTEREGVDPETGEILTVAGLRDVTHIHVPEDNVTLLITPIASYRKAEPETRGGKREPRCKNHPDAPTITTSVTVCSECEVEIDRKITVHQPESSATVFAPDTSVAIKSFNATVFAPDTNPMSDPMPRKGSASNFEPEPPDSWIPPAALDSYPGQAGRDRWTG